MLTQIPIPEGHRISHFEEHNVYNELTGNYTTMYLPVYKPIFEVGECYSNINKEIFLLLSNNNVCNVNGKVIPFNNIGACLPASEIETKLFFDLLEENGFKYNPKTQELDQIFYYFPEYTLYEGFKPRMKLWIDSDADKFYKKHGENFSTFEDCANWCNHLNETLNRDYAEI